MRFKALFFSTLLLFAESNPVILVTGGAGYIGSHTCRALKEAGFTPVVFDSLVFGEKEAVKWGPFIQGDLLDTEALDWAFITYKPVAVFHFAAFRNVGESVENPLPYYTNNVIGSINLLNTMIKHGVASIIFSSSCTVYGNCETSLISEEELQAPINPYGASKQIIERIIEDYGKAYLLKYVILRYFNAAGVEPELKRSTHSCNYLIPKAICSLDSGVSVQVFGSDYKTADGTAIRDYIHVKDLARAHVMAFQYLQEEGKSNTFNLGTGRGYSVLEIIQAIEEVTGRAVSYELKPQRKGDVAQAVAETKKAKEILGFEPNCSDLKAIIQSEWDSL